MFALSRKALGPRLAPLEEQVRTTLPSDTEVMDRLRADPAAVMAKKNLVGAVQVPLQDRRLKIAEQLPLAPVLAEELSLFRVKVTLSANETFEAWRERDHDDLVLALALALYVGSFPPVVCVIV